MNPHHPVYHSHAYSELRQLAESARTASAGASLSRSTLRTRVNTLEAQVRFLALMNRALLARLAGADAAAQEDVVSLMSELDQIEGAVGLDVDVLARELGFEPPRLPEAERLSRASRAMKKSKRRR